MKRVVRNDRGQPCIEKVEKERIAVKIVAVNGSPRRQWNTATLLEKALEGAASVGAETELIHLYELNFKGCLSCFSCKLLNAEHTCAIHDDLTPVLEKLKSADAVIFGSPIYFMSITSGMRACLERFFFPFITYSATVQTFFPKPLPMAFIYTMNIKEEDAVPFKSLFNSFEQFSGRIFLEQAKVLFSCNTWQYSDYDKYMHGYFSTVDKAAARKQQFPKDCLAACQLGAGLVNRAKELAQRRC